MEGNLKFTLLSSRAKRRPLSFIPILALTLFIFATVTYAQVPVSDETCLGCHEDYDRGLEATAHRLTSDVASPKAVIACMSCHPGGEVHSEDPAADNITNPGNAFDQEVRNVCRDCHDAHLELDNIGFDPHMAQGLTCASCHKVHAETEGLLLDESSEFCGQCHIGITAQWNRTSVHPLNDGQVQCLSCHDFTGGQEPGFGHGPSENCYGCHPDVSGPFLWEHNAASSFTPDGEGCIACHAPHGSPNERLLTQAGDALCTQCHGVPPLHNVTHGAIGTQYFCIECHSDVHGSDVNRGLLDANLGSKIGGQPAACYCHGTDR